MIAAFPVGVLRVTIDLSKQTRVAYSCPGAGSQLSISKDERSGLWTRMATESVSSPRANLFAGSIPAPAKLNDIDSRMPVHQASIELQGRAAMPTTDAIGEQVIEAVVAGPDGANRLFTVVGAANVCIEATRQQRTTETWTFLVGPTLTRLQFHRAIGTASVASQIVSVQTAPREFTVNIHSVEADWDDENQRVKVRVEIGLIANGATVTITQIRYSVAILAQM